MAKDVSSASESEEEKEDTAIVSAVSTVLRMKFAMKMTMKSFNSPFLSCFWTGLVSQHPLDGRTRNRWMTRCQGLGGSSKGWVAHGKTGETW
jgi:hypothetical protein